MKNAAFLFALALAACAEAGVNLEPQETDFAFVEVKLQG